MAILLKLALAMTLGIGAKGLASGSGGGGGGGGTPAFDRYVSPTGSALNSGSSSSPWSVAKFLSSGGIVAPGIKVGFLGGNYVGQFVGGSAISGSPTQPVLMQQVPGERATIDGNVGVGSIQASIWRQDASYVWMQDFEVVNTDPIRIFSTSGSNPPDGNWRSAKSLRNTGVGNKYLHLWVHDTANGGEDQSELTAWLTEWNMCKFNSVGWAGPDRGHGHLWYGQNANVLGKLVKNCIGYGSFDIGVQISGDAATMKYITTDGFVLEDCGHDGTNPYSTLLLVHEGVLAGNSAHRRGHYWGKNDLPFRLNAAGAASIPAMEFTDNYVVGQANLNECDAYNNQRNTFIQYALGGQKMLAVRRFAGQPYSAHIEDFNTYFGLDSDQPFYDVIGGVATTRTFAGMKTASGNLYDQNSTFTNALKPTTGRVFVQVSDYETQRAHFICYNWANATTMPLDLSAAGFHAGDPYKIWHEYTDWYGTPDYSGTYDGATPVNAVMAGWVPPDFIGLPGKHCATTAPERCVFILRKG